MENFKKYLEEKRYHPNTVKQMIRLVKKFERWLQTQYGWDIEAFENIQYKHLLDYVQHERQRGISIGGLQGNIGSINRYFEYVSHQNNINHNPARTLKLKGKPKKITENPLSYEQLEKLYQDYKSLTIDHSTLSPNVSHYLKTRMTLSHERNVVMVSLMIWQALASKELERLCVEDVNFSEGTIYIAACGRSNSRTLKLHPQQILSLYSYIHGGVREKLNITTYENKTIGEYLFPGQMQGMVKSITQQLRGINPLVKNAQHIRASVILYWLKQYNKRQVQYMVGHRYINSTEKYAVQQMDTLTDQLTKHHPFG